MSFYPKNEAKAGSWLKDLYSGNDGNCPPDEFNIFLAFSIIKTNIITYRDAHNFFFDIYQTDDKSLSESTYMLECENSERAPKMRSKNDPIFTLSTKRATSGRSQGAHEEAEDVSSPLPRRGKGRSRHNRQPCIGILVDPPSTYFICPL